ncbi:hypothetical protein OH77DRAFT_1409125 [Trametes cingulata]|nr:hypothetical protein OH77DRAFT_1409125 [Trametes cingulata]
MPRLQLSRRTSLLSTNLRNTFLEAFNRSVLAKSAQLIALNAEAAQVDAARSLNTIARRVQADMRRATGRYFPLYQVVASIHALRDSLDDLPTRSGSSSSSSPPTPRPLQILITPTSPPATNNITGTPLSMSRRRLACNIPALQSHLTIPAPAFPMMSPVLGSPTSAFGARPLFTMSRRSSLSSGESTRCPVTPVDQIAPHTPLSPPKIPRAPPPAPRTWAKLNARMHNDEISPLASPAMPYTPYVLSPSHSGRPFLNPLRIPVTCTLAAGDAELRDNHLSPSPSPRSLSPFEPVPSPLGEGSSGSSLIPRRPTPVRNNSTSNLTRTALLRASRPHIARSYSVSEYKQPGEYTEQLLSPLSPLPPSPVALASPFIIQSEEMDTEYFRF